MLTSLFAHLAWADEGARAALHAMPEAAPERERAVTIYAHLAAAEHVWLARLEGRPPVHPVWPTLSLASASALAAESAAGLAAYVARCSDAALDAVITYRTSTGQELRSTVRDILLHVALHGSYHRGQLALLARAAGAEPAATDYIVFTRGAPVAARSSADRSAEVPHTTAG